MDGRWAFRWCRTLHHKESWSTREEAEVRIVKAQGADAWSEKALARFEAYDVVQRGINSKASSTLTTPKNQIVSLVFRHNPGNVGFGPGGLEEVTFAQREKNHG
ncbi:hypothetical protein N7494_002157 [Penicillium frequentans]|uniref:Uncharacterized protein n=1 Tax=Penicillium frequentans TaxID=3151616 RepID=A0AAD6D3F6_9EURO|nr:hypothetical protein N7494_002157 [Penicillium glabrum]